jgi:hypothetical protein
MRMFSVHHFPEAFRFQLTNEETARLVANCDRFESLMHSTVNPYAFTEQGVSMLSAVLRSETAVKVSIQIMNAFVQNMSKIIMKTNVLLGSIRQAGARHFADLPYRQESQGFAETSEPNPASLERHGGLNAVPALRYVLE